MINYERIFFLFLITSIVSSQKYESVIHFKDGTEKSGYIKYGAKPFASNITTTDKVKFRISKESKEVTEFEFSKISKIDLTKSGDVIRTYYFQTPEENLKVVLEVTLEHEGNAVSLYKHIQSVNTSTNGYNPGSINEYYLQKGKKNIVKIFPGKFMGISSENLIKNFFEDCPKLVELIDREAFKMFVANTPSLAKKKNTNRLIEIVKYYNSKCSVEN